MRTSANLKIYQHILKYIIYYSKCINTVSEYYAFISVGFTSHNVGL